jgi:hypothetical protein
LSIQTAKYRMYAIGKIVAEKVQEK